MTPAYSVGIICRQVNTIVTVALTLPRASRQGLGRKINLRRITFGKPHVGLLLLLLFCIDNIVQEFLLLNILTGSLFLTRTRSEFIGIVKFLLLLRLIGSILLLSVSLLNT